MGKRCPKHVEALSFNKVKVMVECIKLVRVSELVAAFRLVLHVY
jgi:hypothetical protein